MVNRTIQNIGKRPHIKHVANIGVTYDTPPDKVDEALDIIKLLLRDHEGMDPEFPPRVVFNAFENCSLNILVIFWYHPPDYWKYMAFTERFNRQLLRRFNEAGIEFAFPSQTVYLSGHGAGAASTHFSGADRTLASGEILG
jgi:MscS family membrane protein